jgi:hypothetical protein
MNWSEWLARGMPFGMDQIESTPALLALALCGSLLSSFLVSFLYVKFYSSRATGSQVHRSFMLIGPSITAIFIAIQFSLPLSLGLLGALSIVRFRTPIKEAEEIGFILLVVAVSLSWATLNLQLLGILLAVVVLGLLLAAGWTWRLGSSQDGMIVVSLPTSDYARKSKELLDALEAGLPKGRIDSISENEDQSVISYVFSRLDRNRLLDLRRDVSKIAERASVNLFFHHSGQL